MSSNYLALRVGDIITPIHKLLIIYKDYDRIDDARCIAVSNINAGHVGVIADVIKFNEHHSVKTLFGNYFGWTYSWRLKKVV